jgi:hypothetical protein
MVPVKKDVPIIFFCSSLDPLLGSSLKYGLTKAFGNYA